MQTQMINAETIKPSTGDNAMRIKLAADVKEMTRAEAQFVCDAIAERYGDDLPCVGTEQYDILPRQSQTSRTGWDVEITAKNSSGDLIDLPRGLFNWKLALESYVLGLLDATREPLPRDLITVAQVKAYEAARTK